MEAVTNFVGRHEAGKANYVAWALYAALGAVAGHQAHRLHQFAPLAIAGALSGAELIDSRGKDHVREFKMSSLGFAIPFARAFALSAGVTALATHTGGFGIATAKTLAFKAAPAVVGLATAGYTYYGFTHTPYRAMLVGGQPSPPWPTRLGYAVDLGREALE